MVNFIFVALPHDPVSIVTISMSWRNKLEPGTDWNNVVNFSDHLAYSETIGNIQVAWFWIVGSTHETWRPPFEQMRFLCVKLKTQFGYYRLNTAPMKILRMFITTVWATIWNEWTWKTNVSQITNNCKTALPCITYWSLEERQSECTAECRALYTVRLL